jgi:hypothetical protein
LDECEDADFKIGYDHFMFFSIYLLSFTIILEFFLEELRKSRKKKISIVFSWLGLGEAWNTQHRSESCLKWNCVLI